MSADSPTWIVIADDEVVFRCHDRREALGYLRCYGEHVSDEPVLATVEHANTKGGER